MNAFLAVPNMIFPQSLPCGERRAAVLVLVCLRSSSSMSSLWTPENESDYTPFPEDLGPGADICDLDAYVVDPQHPFDNEAVFERATVELQNFSTWWYTSTLGQDAQAASAAVPASDSGSASVLLGDPGFYVACLVLSEEDCIAIDCVEFLVHQPNSDFFQVFRARLCTTQGRGPSSIVP